MEQVPGLLVIGSTHNQLRSQCQILDRKYFTLFFCKKMIRSSKIINSLHTNFFLSSLISRYLGFGIKSSIALVPDDDKGRQRGRERRMSNYNIHESNDRGRRLDSTVSFNSVWIGG